MLCDSCKQALLGVDVGPQHSKQCQLWPFGLEERLCILGALKVPRLQHILSSYRMCVRREDGEEIEEVSSLPFTFSPLPCFSDLVQTQFSLPPYFLMSSEASMFLFSSIQSGLVERILQRCVVQWKNPKEGFGLFAREKFQKGEVLGLYSGKVRKLTFFSKKEDLSYTAELVRHFPWSFPYVVDAKEIGNMSRFINHSNTPNLAVEYVRACGLPFLLIRTLRSICPEEEFFLSYGHDFEKHAFQFGK